jgi:hypothetical protein
MDWSDLMIRVEDIDAMSLLAEWDWLLEVPCRPFVLNVFGDWFLQDSQRQIHFLDLMTGRLEVIAPSPEAFREEARKVENKMLWFMAHHVLDLRNAGITLGPGECFGYKDPPVLGGAQVVDNIGPTNLAVYQSLMSQIHQQVHDLPEGTEVSLKLNLPDQ